MDEAVARAMRRWPNVPRVYGWLRLDRRGRWRVKMPRGDFEAIAHEGMVACIGRNYARDDAGRWFFQNGPQRVFVTMEATPWIYRLTPDGRRVETHTGLAPARITEAWLTDEGGLGLATELGPGLLLDRDLPAIEPAIIAHGGARPRDATLARWFDSAAAAKTDTTENAVPFCLALPGARVPLGRTANGDLARRFGFDPDPRPAPEEPEC